MKQLLFVFSFALILASCSKEDPQLLENIETEQNITTRSTNGISQSFTVRIENISSEEPFPMPFAPGVWVVQKKNSNPIFEAGSSDFGDGLEALAEDGNPGPLNASLENHPKVRSKGVFSVPVGSAGPAPIFSGGAYEFHFTAKPNDYLNFATMYVQSNDLFVGPNENGIPLFDRYGNAKHGDITRYLKLWDAGTEVNEEPGVGPNQAPRQSGPNTGLDENGVVQTVNDGYSYPAVSDMIKVTIYSN